MRSVADAGPDSRPFSHSLGHFQTSRRTLLMVRFTPESCRDRRPIATAEKGQKLPSSLGYSITSSAMARSVGGTVRPKVLAVLRLITNSNLVGACTGRSAGFSPLRMRST